MFSTLSLFRIISIIEGLSYLVLVFFAMPMKYLYGEPLILKFIGMGHGVLFIAFVGLLYLFCKKHQVQKETRNDFFIYSLSPFGFWLIESKLKKYL